MEYSWRGKKCLKVSLQSLTVSPMCADIIYLDNSKYVEITRKQKFIDFFSESILGKILCLSNTIETVYFGTPFHFEIHKINSNSVDYIDKSDNNNWFYIDKSTKLHILNTNEENTSKRKFIIGGLDSTLCDLKTLINAAFKNSNNSSNIHPLRCVLLYGSSGTGKTMICKQMASQSDAHVVNICGSQIFSRFYGETEAKLKTAFDEAIKNSPSIILMDEIDTLCPKQSSASTEQEKRIISTLGTLLDDLHNDAEKNVFILACTSKPDMIDASLRRYGRIDYEIEIPIPDRNARLDIMKKMFENFPHNLTDHEINELSESAHGFVGADIANIFTQATMHMLKNKNDELIAQFKDFCWALQQIKPSAMREVLLDIPNVKWSDIGGQQELKLKLKQAVEWPLCHSESFVRLGIKPPSGVLMYGPPGCSKTMIAKALANESGLNFLSIKGPELFSKWVGESERAVRDLFRKARQVAPSIIFFDEIDAISGERSKNSGSSNVQERVLAQILTELDGISPLGNVTIVAATNRPDKIDSALLRPGRLDRIIYVPLPDEETRASIFKIKFSKMPLSKDISIDYLVENTKNYSGAEIQAVCHEAALKALEDDINCIEVLMKHFDIALQIIKPRTPENLLNVYEKFNESFLKM